MKALTQRILSHPSYHRVVNWSKLLTLTGGAQALIQGLSLVTGIIIIRLLPMQEYAYYTVANTMLGMMTILADGGISSGTMAEGAKVWQDKKKLGMVLATGAALRKQFALYSVIVSTILLGWLLWHQGAGWITILLIALALIPGFLATITDTLYEVIPKLHQAIIPLQKNQINVSLGRIVLSSITLLIFPWTFIALLANGIPRIAGNYRLKAIANNFVDHTQLPDADTRKRILKVVKRMMPESIYYCLSGQIAIWIISLSGSTAELASVGAISRLTLLIHPLAITFAILVTPRFVKLHHNKTLLLKAALLILTTIILLSGIIIAVVSLFSNVFLQILGTEYAGFQSELVLSMIGGCITLLSGCFFNLLVNKGWVINPVIYITINVLAIAVLGSILDISTLSGVLIFNGAIAAVQAITLIVYCFIKIIRMDSSVNIDPTTNIN
jgi:O-antigen/teichoic acid export membrane protein